jgi:hypothetical protein
MARRAVQADVSCDAMLIVDWDDWLELKRYHGDDDTPDLAITFTLQDPPDVNHVTHDSNTAIAAPLEAFVDAGPSAPAPPPIQEGRTQKEAAASTPSGRSEHGDSSPVCVAMSAGESGEEAGQHLTAEQREASVGRDSAAIDVTGGEEASPWEVPPAVTPAEAAACGVSVVLSNLQCVDVHEWQSCSSWFSGTPRPALGLNQHHGTNAFLQYLCALCMRTSSCSSHVSAGVFVLRWRMHHVDVVKMLLLLL